MTNYTATELHMKLERALHEFISNDIDLLCLDAHEISITHKLAEHLQRQFRSLKVDCEYNRLGDDQKKLLDDHKVRPDIIVHQRGRKGSNTLVVEVKKTNSDAQNNDEFRLKEFTRDRGCYEYGSGLFLVFDVRGQSGLKHAECYRGGEKINPCCCCGSLVEEFESSR